MSNQSHTTPNSVFNAEAAESAEKEKIYFASAPFATSALIAVVLLLAVCALAACSTSKSQGVSAFELADEPEESDLLDEPVDPSKTRRQAGGDDDGFALMLPEPPAEMSKTIDGRADDWKASKARVYDGDEHVVSGRQFRSGRDDASFRVSVDSDLGRVYFLIEVRDDVVIDAGSEDTIADGVVLWLRDPKLNEVVKSLPAGARRDRNVEPEIGILFTPDGLFERYDRPDGSLYRTGIEAAERKLKNGYRLEIALSLGVLGQVASLPTEEVAFRVELIDGDEADRRGEQTRMSMFPDQSGPQFALYDVGGWLPYEGTRGHAPKMGTLGRWKLDEGAWSFDSFEVVPTHWVVVQETTSFEQALTDSEVLSELCPAARTERRLVQGYQSRSGRHRAGLVTCATRAPGGRCPKDGATHLYWVRLEPTDAGWRLAEHVEVTDEPLEQCADTPGPSGDLYGDFSLLPMEMLGSAVWGVGWSMEFAERHEELVEKGIWFVNPLADTPIVGEANTQRVHATTDERRRSNSKVYLTPVDDVKGLDVCRVEHVEQQYCRGLNRNCTTGEHGEAVHTHIETWVPEERRFEPYLLTKHKRCNARFDFDERKGFLLINETGRLGAIPSPKN
jgi:hypothetical protein